MKKTFLLASLLLFSLGSFSQQALWGIPTILSPEVNPDNTVTIRVVAENAQKVQVTGDFLPPQKNGSGKFVYYTEGVVDLIKGENNIWEYTSQPLTPELYKYNIIVDGVKTNDPLNVHKVRDVGSIFDIFIIGGGNADLYQVQNVPHGNISKVWYDSPTVNQTRRLTVYTPAGYNTSKTKYPVFYLLHGMGGDEEAWCTLGRAAQILDNLIAKGLAEPMIVVMTNGNIALNAAPGEDEKGLYAPTIALPNTMDGTFEKAFPDIIKFIESNYRVLKDKKHQAIAGLSMGGFHSKNISAMYPNKFGYVGLFSAAINPNGEFEPYKDLDSKIDTQFKNPPMYWIGIGTDDFLFQDNQKYMQYLKEKGYPFTYRESGKGHIWENWRIYLSEFVPLLFK